jgi:hypothetical protein
MDDRVVVERFEPDPERWSGISLSVFHEGQGWRQTRVDSTGGVPWSGGRRGSSFSVTEVEDGREVERRMVFFAIEADTFPWRWGRSMDGGATWESPWSIGYQRATDGA